MKFNILIQQTKEQTKELVVVRVGMGKTSEPPSVSVETKAKCLYNQKSLVQRNINFI